MTQLSRARIRLEADAAKNTENDAMKDVLWNATPHLWRGNDVQFEIGLFVAGTIVDDVNNIESLTVEVRPSSDRTGTPVMTKTLQAGDLNSPPTQAEWDTQDATKCHALVVFTGDETNVNLGTATSVAYWLTVSVVTTDSPGRDITVGFSTLTIEEDGAGAAGSPPTNDPLYYTRTQCDARYARQTPDAGSYRVKDGQHIQLYNPDQDKWHTVTVRGAAGSEHIDIGEGET